jgi:hypothetical protein
MKAQQKKEYSEKNNQQVYKHNDKEAVSAIAPSIGLDRVGAEDHIESLIDEAVEGTFPCSDPPAYNCAKEAQAKISYKDAAANKQTN